MPRRPTEKPATDAEAKPAAAGKGRDAGTVSAQTYGRHSGRREELEPERRGRFTPFGRLPVRALSFAALLCDGLSQERRPLRVRQEMHAAIASDACEPHSTSPTMCCRQPRSVLARRRRPAAK